MRRASIALYALLFASLAITTVPRLIAMLREATEFRHLSYKERRVRMGNEGVYGPIVQLRSTLAPGEPIALVLNPHPHNIGFAIFTDYYLYPAPVKLYFSRSIYNADQSPQRPAAIAYVQYGHDPYLRRASYAEIRAEEIGRGFVVDRLEPSATASSFIVPIVSSGEGPAPDTYTCEAIIENGALSDAHVALDMFPSRRHSDITLKPGERRSWNDLVYQVFGVLEFGWLRVSSDRPVASAFWFANAGRHSASAVPSVSRLSMRGGVFVVPSGGRVWVLNPHDSDLRFFMNGNPRTSGPLSLTGIRIEGSVRIVSEQEIYAFTSWRDSAGRTLFSWPDVK